MAGDRNGDGPPSRTRRAELQNALGDAGTVLPRQAHGTPARPAQGWYAQMRDGSEAFLGDYTGLAMLTITEIIGA